MPARRGPDRGARGREQCRGERCAGDDREHRAKLGAAEAEDDHRDERERQPEDERRVEVRPEKDERWHRDEHARPFPRDAQEEEQEREAEEAHELRPFGPGEARQGDRGQRREHGDDRARLRAERRGDDERRDPRDEQGPQQDDPGPAKPRVRPVPRDLSEPLIGQHRHARHGPRKLIDAREAFRQRLPSLREMPEEVRIADGRDGRERAEDPAAEKRDRPRGAATHGRASTIHRPLASDARTRQPSSRRATASGRSGSRSSSLTRYLSTSARHPGRSPTIAR